jgi:outer membrane translocation and assembly module TamA
MAGCASIPGESYGIRRLSFTGVQALDAEALRACLASEQRPKLTLGLSALRDPRCGEPPFDKSRLSLRLFSWPWTDWPVYDEAVFKLDLERVTRWYRARGYYGATVSAVNFKPQAASASDIARCDGEGCPLSIELVISEGAPVRIRKLELHGAEKLPKALQKRVSSALRLKLGQVFDEARYDQARERMTRVLRDSGHAKAEVTGEAKVYADNLSVYLSFTLKPGRVYRIGNVTVKSASPIPEAPVLAAALLRSGSIYRTSDLEDAERAVFALGGFSSVRVYGDPDDAGGRIDVVVEVEPRRSSVWMFGGGVMSGILTTGVVAPEWVSVPQWDIHLSGSYEHRNFLGGLRRLRIEERPRLIFLGPFPTIPADSPRFGNTLKVAFTQPGVLEPRTSLFSEARWDLGPDPFLLFFRNDIGLSVGLERSFLKQRLQAAVAAHQDFMFVGQYQPIVDDAPSSYVLPFLEQRISLDLRDVPRDPNYGAYFALVAHEAFKIGRSWNYLRLTPDVRAYAPLGLGIVLAGRFALGWLEIFKASSELDAESQQLGPVNYRLRGGGAQSNRGFLPGQLGDGVEGGIRRWESSLELRIPLTQSLTVAVFTDLGNVSPVRDFQFSKLNTAMGGGLRYRTIVGPIRFDVGYRPPGLQTTDGSPGDSSTMHIFGRNFTGAVHLTVGEPF